MRYGYKPFGCFDEGFWVRIGTHENSEVDR
jgi:hypothetical protein